jgi:hypothetical protein
MSTTTSGTPPSAGAADERCGQCGAPAASDQRYCVNCGFHRRNARDPVARYLSEASAARTRVLAAEARAAGHRRTHRLGMRVVTVLVALALLTGILIGNLTAGKSGSSSPGQRNQTTQKHTGSKVKNETGSSYLQQENNLPNSVSP